jgi:hypothetical protein
MRTISYWIATSAAYVENKAENFINKRDKH